ncbi:hypothetical protein MOK15_00520 [Sphingobium sp. BYY-5]|nr:hypothetical protein [Sphingobium sp. BYY-5]MCI4588592.1 hypothetical protein [Sphingobium sp. BYY-5]
MATPTGQGLAASIITAFYNKNMLNIIGTGTCSILAGVETVSYVSIIP